MSKAYRPINQKYIRSDSIMFPIGTVLITVNNNNPTNWTYGTWEQFAHGRCLMGEGVVQANTDNWCGTTNAGDWTGHAGLMGGEVWHYLNIAEMPSHTHGVYGAMSGNTWPITNTGNDWQLTTRSWNNNMLTYTGEGKAHNNMPPYIVVYFWKRVS